MQLLVSVASAADAAEALAGGAHIIDAKDPAAGAIGAVPAPVLRAIRQRVGDGRPLSAALGDAAGAASVERDAFAAAAAGMAFVKVGFAGTVSRVEVARLLEAAQRGARRGGPGCGVVAVAYADATRAASVAPRDVLLAAATVGIGGILLDTADKNGPGLCALLSRQAIARWVADARSAGLRVMLAGRLAADDLPLLREAGADIAGVRGAACDGGRAGRISSAKVAALVQLVGGNGDGRDAIRQRALEVGVDEIAG